MQIRTYILLEPWKHLQYMFLLILHIQYWTYLIYMTLYFHLWLQWLRYLVHTDSRWSLNTKHTENLYYTDLFYMTFFKGHMFSMSGFFKALNGVDLLYAQCVPSLHIGVETFLKLHYKSYIFFKLLIFIQMRAIKSKNSIS